MRIELGVETATLEKLMTTELAPQDMARAESEGGGDFDDFDEDDFDDEFDDDFEEEEDNFDHGDPDLDEQVGGNDSDKGKAK